MPAPSVSLRVCGGATLGVTRAVADRLQVGMPINDAVTHSMPPPFGGRKASGFGRTRGLMGLGEFVTPQVIHSRSNTSFRPQLFPYSERSLKLLRSIDDFFIRLDDGHLDSTSEGFLSYNVNRLKRPDLVARRIGRASGMDPKEDLSQDDSLGD